MGLFLGFILGTICLLVVMAIGVSFYYLIKVRVVVDLHQVGFPARVIMDRWYWKVTVVYNGQKTKHKFSGEHKIIKVDDVIFDINFAEKAPLKFYRCFPEEVNQ